MKLNSFKTPLTKLYDYGFCNGIPHLQFSPFFTLPTRCLIISLNESFVEEVTDAL
ncbi:hypothetical protein Hanom_Chr06g00501131 [Helianthus anomalus]